MDKFKGLELINNLDRLIVNNNAVINAVDQDKEINTKKAIKACMKSNNEIARILKIIIGTNNQGGDYSYSNAMNDFLKQFQG